MAACGLVLGRARCRARIYSRQGRAPHGRSGSRANDVGLCAAKADAHGGFTAAADVCRCMTCVSPCTVAPSPCLPHRTVVPYREQGCVPLQATGAPEQRGVASLAQHVLRHPAESHTEPRKGARPVSSMVVVRASWCCRARHAAGLQAGGRTSHTCAAQKLVWRQMPLNSPL